MDNNFYNNEMQQNNYNEQQDNGMYNQNMNTGGMNNMGMGMNNMQYQQNQGMPDFAKYLILSIVQLFCCCTPTAIVALIFMMLANSSFKCGNYNDYNAKIKTMKTSLTVGWIIGAILFVINFIRIIAMILK